MKKCGETINMILFSVFFLFLIQGCDWLVEKDKGKTGKNILIYIVADNSLSSFAEQDIEEIRNAEVPAYFTNGESGDVLLVYIHQLNENPKLLRYYMDDLGVVNEEVLRVYEDEDGNVHNSLDPEVMREVLTYAVNLFPADEYGLVLWSHATGWLPPGYYSNPKTYGAEPLSVWEDRYAHLVKSFGYSKTYDGYEMDIKDLAAALPIKYSFIILDACLMGGIEIAYELKDKCDYLIFSPAEVLARGMPYDKVISSMFSSGEEALIEVCEGFYNANAVQGASTVSMVDTRYLDTLALACFDIFHGVQSYADLDMSDIQGYFRGNRKWFYDLDDFVKRISSQTLYETFDSVMRDLVVCKYATEKFVVGSDSFDIKNYSGLSTYIPNPENPYLEEYYQTLAWNKAVGMIE